jgi:Protein of unknown function (DUF3179)
MPSTISEAATPRSRRRWAGFILFLLILAVIAMVAVPVFLIRPFSPQTPGGLAVAFALRRWAPLATALALIAGLALAFTLWRGGRWWSRALVVLALIPLAGAAWLARFNIFEKMFSPLGGARFAPAAEASWVEDRDLVLAVERDGEAAAYPVRQVAYHHIVHDVVGGVPVAVTY